MLVQKWKYFLNYVEFAVPATYFTITLVLFLVLCLASTNLACPSPIDKRKDRIERPARQARNFWHRRIPADTYKK